MAPKSARVLCNCTLAKRQNGRFICQCAALVNPFLLILAVFSAAGSLSDKNHANSNQLWLVFRWPIAPACLSTSLPADTKAKSLVNAIYGRVGIVFKIIFTVLSLGRKFFANSIQNRLIDNLATSHIQPICQVRIIVKRGNTLVSQCQHMRQGCVIQGFR